MKPMVTVGIPTYNRPDLLPRSLGSIAKQDYPNLEVVVADNASSGDQNREVVRTIGASLSNLTYVKHPTNIGSLNNFAFLLQRAEGKYFMWLADDDEVSSNYVATLVDLLERNPDAVSATGHWRLMASETRGSVMPTSSFPQSSVVARSARFIWGSDDAFFYALHRTEDLRRASFPGYSWPNQQVFLNWAYVYLLDMVLQGRVLLASDPSVQFINHDYTAKDYSRSTPKLQAAVQFALRRLNVHYLYWKKCAKFVHPFAMPVIMLTSALALVRDGAEYVARGAMRVARRGAS